MPTLSLSASSKLVGLGSSSTLSWSATNVTSCNASGGWSGDRPTSGSETITPAMTATYTLTCANTTSSTTQSVTITVDAQGPSANLTSPAIGATVTGTVTLSATASDDQGIGRVEFYKDGTLLGADNTVPYSMTWDTFQDTNGSHVIAVRAFDIAGNQSSPSSVTVLVANIADTQAPQVALLSPSDGSQIAGRVKVQASAADNIAVTRLDLYIDGSLKASSTTGSVSISWNVNGKSIAPGVHSISAKGIDAAGNIGTLSIAVFK